jgi:hypothetical protein
MTASGVRGGGAAPSLNGRFPIAQPTSAVASGADGLAPTADVCDKGVLPLRPRTMLSLKKAGILSCATRPG